MRIRRHLIEVDFTCPHKAAGMPAVHTVEERARGAAPPYTTVRFRDLHGEVVAFARHTHQLGKTAEKLRKQHETARGWHMRAIEWQLRLSIARVPSLHDVAQCAAQQLEAAIEAKQSVAIQTVDLKWRIVLGEELDTLVATAQRATSAHIFVYPPRSLLAYMPPLLLNIG